MKTFKTLLAAVVLTAAPGLAIAECGWSKQEQVTMSCAPGTTFDADANACVTETMS